MLEKKSKMATQTKIKSPINVLLYPFKGLFYVVYTLSTSTYEFVKYSFLGFKYLLHTNFKIFKNAGKGCLATCTGIYNIFKYAGKGINFTVGYPVQNLNNHKSAIKTKNNVKTIKNESTIPFIENDMSNISKIENDDQITSSNFSNNDINNIESDINSDINFNENFENINNNIESDINGDISFSENIEKNNTNNMESSENIIEENKFLENESTQNTDQISLNDKEKKAIAYAEKKEKKKLEKQQQIERKKQERLQKIEDKKKRKEERKNKKKNDSEAYINENVKIEKPTFSQKLKSFNKNFGKSLNKINNNSFARNRRNRKDIKQQALLIDFEGADAEKSDKKVLYEYVAKDKNGKVVKDYFNAFSKVEVHSFLLSEGYEVYSIKTNKFIQMFHNNSNTNKTKIKTKDLIFFLSQLSTYIKAGIPLVEALRIISRQYKQKSYQKIFRSIIYELTMGENFSDAMAKQNNAFPRLLINMVRTAEMTGSLPEVLDDMEVYYSESEATRKQMITAMTYPSLVFVFAMGVMIFIMIYVVPQFVGIYASMGDTKLPLITEIILNISSFLKNYYIFLIIGIIVVIASFIISYKKIKGFRTICQWIIMHVPVIKTTIMYNEVTMFTKTFSSLLSHNVPITECMDILNKITNNEIYKMLILDTITNLARGGKISEAFKDHWAFPLPAYEMIVTGEATGELSEMMDKVSIYYQGLHKESVTRIKTFVEPLLTIFLTFGVGFILLAIIIPMFDMYSAVQEMG